MRKRIELNTDAPPVRIPGRLLNELYAHALETLPEECCGLISGGSGERFQSVYRCRNEMTRLHRTDPESYPRDGREAYFMSEHDLMSSMRDAEARGQRVTAVYHSHVGAGAYFSEMDQEHADHDLFPFPDAAHLVLAVWQKQVRNVGIFERETVGGPFLGRRAEADQP